jgi:hypothetical protein
VAIKDIARERQLVELAPEFKPRFHMPEVVSNILFDIISGDFQLQTTRGRAVYAAFINYLVERFLKSNTGVIHRSYWGQHREVLKTEDFVQSLTVCLLDYVRQLLNTKTSHIDKKAEKLIFVISTLQRQRWYLMTHHRVYLSTGKLLPLRLLYGLTYLRSKMKKWGDKAYQLIINYGDDILNEKNRGEIVREVFDAIPKENRNLGTWDTLTRLIYLDNSRQRTTDIRELFTIHMEVETKMFFYGSKRTLELKDWKI